MAEQRKTEIVTEINKSNFVRPESAKLFIEIMNKHYWRKKNG